MLHLVPTDGGLRARVGIIVCECGMGRRKNLLQRWEDMLPLYIGWCGARIRGCWLVRVRTARTRFVYVCRFLLYSSETHLATDLGPEDVCHTSVGGGVFSYNRRLYDEDLCGGKTRMRPHGRHATGQTRWAEMLDSHSNLSCYIISIIEISVALVV